MTILVIPSLNYLASYRGALERDWSPDNVRGLDATREQLAAIASDPERFVASLDDPEGKLPPFELPDGTVVQRLPSIRRWIWDGEAVGSIGLRWQVGTPKLPAHVLGHIGYAVVPWGKGRGYATKALGLMLHEARARGLPYVEITTKPDNLASQRVILANGGVLVERFREVAAYGGAEALRFRIAL